MTEIETNYDAGEFVGGTFIKKEDLAAGPQRFTIEGVSTATFEARNGRPESTVLQLDVGDGRKFSLGTKINVKILIAAFGRKTADWIGKEIVLFIDPNVAFGGSLVGGVRVRIPDSRADLQRDIAEAMPTRVETNTAVV